MLMFPENQQPEMAIFFPPSVFPFQLLNVFEITITSFSVLLLLH